MNCQVCGEVCETSQEIVNEVCEGCTCTAIDHGILNSAS